jgi:hypothetical protein
MNFVIMVVMMNNTDQEDHDACMMLLDALPVGSYRISTLTRYR